MVENLGGGILALIAALIDHPGAVQRDLIIQRFRIDDMGRGDEITFAELATLVANATPDTTVFFAKHEGWNLGNHLAAITVDALETLVWLKTEDATKLPELQQYRPKPMPRPGVVYVEPEPEDDGRLTAEGYLNMVGYVIVED